MENTLFPDQQDFLKTDVLKDWMQHRDMASSQSTCYSSSPQQPPLTTSSDNNAQQTQQEQFPPHQQQQQQHQSSLSSLESFLFLPQLPVDGDDDDENAWLFPCHHYPRQPNQQEQQQNKQQGSLSSSLLAIANPNSTTNSSTGRITSRTYITTTNTNNPAHENNDHEKRCGNKQCYSNTTNITSSSINSNNSSEVYGGKLCKPTNFLFPFKAANCTVITAASCNNSNYDENVDDDDGVVNNNKKSQQQKLSSSMAILINKNTNSKSNNCSHNNSNYPPQRFCLTADNHYHRHQENHSEFHEQCHPDQQHHHHHHLRHFIRRRLLIFRICQALSVLLCMLFLLNLVKNSIWAEDEYKSRMDEGAAVPSMLSPSSLTSSSRLQNRLIQSWNMPSIISPSSLLSPSSSSSSTFGMPEIVSVGSTSSHHNDDHAGADDDSYRHNLMLLDVPIFRFLMNNKTKCNIPRDDDNYFGGGADDDGATSANNDKSKGNGASTIFFMIIVHSAPQNFEERQAIRETWGSLQRLGQFHIRIVFLLGHEMNPDDDDDNDKHPHHHQHHDYDHNSNNSKDNNNISSGNNNVVAGNKHGDSGSKLYSKLQRESQQHGDIVTGNFHDSYRNLTYKHLMGYLWVLNHCSHAKYILKADDDAFIDIFQLFEFLLRTFGKDPEAALICNVFPEGTKPVRGTDVLGKKWAVTYEEYPYETYPKYCGGLAYLATPNVIREIYTMSKSVGRKYLWIDDVYVTGILRELAHVEPFYLNLRYLYDPEEYRKWLDNTNMVSNSVKKSNAWDDKDTDKGTSSSSSPTEITYNNDTHDSRGRAQLQVTAEAAALSNRMSNEQLPSPPQKIPFMIVHLERGTQLGREMRELWNKTVTVWSKSGLMN